MRAGASRLGLLLIVLCSGVAVQAQHAGGPTGEEAEALVWINALRADPAGEGMAIASLGWRRYDIPRYVDIDMFLDEMLACEPAPPLVFDARLIEAARSHSRYMVANGQGHGEEPGLRHFTGRSFTDRARHVGYDYRTISENVFVAGHFVHQSHVAFVIDWGLEGDEGGMQAGRGHRAALLSPWYTEAGVGVVAWEEDAASGGRDLLSVTHALASPRERRRCVGGVVYIDRNRNRRFDAGEGVGGVAIAASDGSETTTWESGAFTLVLAGEGAVTVRAEEGILYRELAIDEGYENVGFDWVMPRQVDEDRIARLVAVCRAVDDDDAAGRWRAAVALYLATRDQVTPEGLVDEVDQLLDGVAEGIETDKRLVLDELLDDPDGRSDLWSERRIAYERTDMLAWFSQVGKASRIMRLIERLDGIPAHARQDRLIVLRRIYRERNEVTDPEVRALIDPVIPGLE